MNPDWNVNELTTSLADTPTVYARGHIRVVNAESIRLQGSLKGSMWEDVQAVSDKLREYIVELPHTCSSLANSGTTYAPCLMRREKHIGSAIRVQIAGPAFNRPWGAEFVLVSCAYAGRLPAPEPVAASPADKSLSLGGFKIGDKIVVVKRGDGDGCGGGPAVGTEGVVVSLSGISGCGPIKIEYDHGDKWALTAKNIAHVPEPCTKPDPLHSLNSMDWLEVKLSDLEVTLSPDAPTASPPTKAKFAKGPDKFTNLNAPCLTCGYTYGEHYGGMNTGLLCPTDKYPEKYASKLGNPASNEAPF